MPDTTGGDGASRPRGRHQRAIWTKVKANPQNSYPMPNGSAERALWGAVKRLIEKGMLQLEPCGRRYRIARRG